METMQMVATVAQQEHFLIQAPQNVLHVQQETHPQQYLQVVPTVILVQQEHI